MIVATFAQALFSFIQMLLSALLYRDWLPFLAKDSLLMMRAGPFSGLNRCSFFSKRLRIIAQCSINDIAI